MTIALDATYSTGGQLSGVGLYSHEILFGTAAAHPEARFHFCYRPHRYLRARRIPLPPNVRRRLILEPFSPRGADLFHGLNQRLPNMRFRRTVATFHDLFVMSGEYSTPEFRARFTAQARDAAARADAIIAVSEFTRSQVIALLGVEPSRVHVVHHGIRRLEFPAAGNPAAGDSAVGNPAVGNPAVGNPAVGDSAVGNPAVGNPAVGNPAVERQKVILSVGAIQTRKNIARLVEAFETVDPSWRLVLAGSAGYGSGEILARIAASGARERISVTGYVSPAELGAWYATASIFAFPSLDEGFGMPVLEAMAAGIPVLTSNRSALPEVAGDAAMLVDPENTGELARALRDLTQGEELRRELASRGADRARLFSWEKAVVQTWDVYRKLLG